jgi:hypothetical protein
MLSAGGSPAHPTLPFRVIRTEGRFGLVAMPHTAVPQFRADWGTTIEGGSRPQLRVLRSYGTLLKGKRWLARRRPSDRPHNESDAPA